MPTRTPLLRQISAAVTGGLPRVEGHRSREPSPGTWHGRSAGGSWGGRPGASEPRPDLGAARLGRRCRMLGRQGKEEVESAGRCTGGPPAVEQTPRPPALGPRPARAALALPVPPCILNTRVHRLP
ncbi:hypothetical protein PVAP13_9NG416700 [Panicum virgatum]|uniref:Uncharacterized protein n=1 Tax=Panicum virgatum TaxID=38727 RepID=A0A8T0MXP8_PANVG|nr:hypothetical protein PVAP13_9NG416700 [Panicum virgatum]